MTVQAAIESELPFLRAEAEARMLDQFDIVLPADDADSPWSYDPELGYDVEDLEVLFSTRGRVKVPGGLAVRDLEVGGRSAASVTRELHIPVDSARIPAGAIAVCTSVHSTSDPTLLGARLQLAGPAPGSQTTARRLEVTEVIS